MDNIFNPLMFIFWPIVIIGGLIFLLSRLSGRRRRGGQIKKEKEWYFRIALSREDAYFQWFILLSAIFLWIALLAVNKDFGMYFANTSVLLISALVALVVGYKFRALYTILAGILSMLIWLGVKFSDWTYGKDIKALSFVGIYFLIAVLFFALGRLLGKEMKYTRLSIALRALGLLFAVGFLFFISSKMGLQFFEDGLRGDFIFRSWQITISYLLVAFALVLSLIYGYSTKVLRWYETLIASALGIFFALILFVPEHSLFVADYYYNYNQVLSAEGMLWAAVWNALLLFVLLGAIFTGYLKREKWLINLSIFLTFVFVIIKYFDFFTSFIDKSIILIVSGVLFLLLGWLMEWGRRMLISKLKSPEGSKII